MIIELNSVVLREFRDDDLEFVFSGLSNPKVIKNYGISYESIIDCKEQMKWYKKISAERVGYWFAIEAKFTKDKLGALGINNICQKNNSAEIGYWLLPENWGRGIMKEAITGLLFFVFNELNIHRVSATVDVDNLNSQRTLQSLNFTMEGISRECEIKDGKYISLLNYSLLKNDLI